MMQTNQSIKKSNMIIHLHFQCYFPQILINDGWKLVYYLEISFKFDNLYLELQRIVCIFNTMNIS